MKGEIRILKREDLKQRDNGVDPRRKTQASQNPLEQSVDDSVSLNGSIMTKASMDGCARGTFYESAASNGRGV